jgi:transcription initiation factor TFIIH subunit 4
MGLIEKSIEEGEAGKKFCKFRVTKLMQSFLLTSQNHSEKLEPREKFIIIETNFRVFAYIDKEQDKLYRAILKLFLEVKIDFPKMLYGVFTKNSISKAFRQKISADQIMAFLRKHSHPDANYN